MADFPVTHVIALVGTTVSGTTSLSWNMTLSTTQNGTIIDNDPVGVLNLTDTISTGTFSGFYIEVDGALFGVFKVGSAYIVPYNAAIRDLAPLVSTGPGSTTTYLASLENAANCFLDGTLIATPGGDRPIEGLAPGDLVMTADGGPVAVLWIWRHEVTNVFGLVGDRAPVRVAAGALGDGTPLRDLIVSADHALLVDGVLINAGALLNGKTITKVQLADMPMHFTYWHIETEAHVALVAEGCASESFIDYTPRDRFDNFAAFEAAGGESRPIPEMRLPRISSRRLLPPYLRQRLGIDRAA